MFQSPHRFGQLFHAFLLSRDLKLEGFHSLLAGDAFSLHRLGTLQLHPLTTERNWSEDDLAVVEAVVDELARAAENLRLFEEARERASFESLVGEINEKLHQAPTLDILAKTAAEALGSALGVSHSLIKVGVTPPPPPGHTARNGEQG